jgi:hypothetical protein
MNDTPKPFTPLSTLELLIARVPEVLSYYDGTIGDEQYPPWARKIGGELAEQLLPASWLVSAKTHSRQFCEGMSMGLAVERQLEVEVGAN